MNARILKAPLLMAAALLLVSGQTLAGTRFVNCGDGDSLQKAIDAGAGSAATVYIVVTGVCTEDLLITKDRVIINGDGNTVIDGEVTVRGADNLTIKYLTITGSRNGINASVARVRLINVDLVANHSYGMALRHGGSIFMSGGSIENNQGGIGLLIENGHGQLENVEVFDNDVDGIVINVNGNLTMVGGSVTLHENGTGVTANLSSSVELEDVSVSNNLAGISVSMGAAAAINNSTINENMDVGIVVNSGNLGLNNVEISGNRAGIAASMAKITLQDTRVINNEERGIDVAQTSALIVSGGAVNGNGNVGVIVDEGSSFAADRVEIMENGTNGVAVRWNSNADIVGCTIGYNALVNTRRSGVFVSSSSSATIDSTKLFGNGTGVGVSRQSFVNLTGDTAVWDNSSGGMRLSYDSGAIVNDPVVIRDIGSSPAVSCNDTESSFENRSDHVESVSCKGFDLP